MNITTRFENKTLSKVIDVVTDRSGTWCEGSEVFTRKEVELHRDGHRLTAAQTNKLFAYYHAAGHTITIQSR